MTNLAWTPIVVTLLGAVAGPILDSIRSRSRAAVLDALWVADGPLSNTELYRRLEPLSQARVNRALRHLVKNGRVIVVGASRRYTLPEGGPAPGGRRGWRHRLAPSLAGLVLGACIGVPVVLVSTRPPGTAPSVQPLRAIFGQAGDGRAFRFQNYGGSLQASYSKETDCRRASRPVGLRLAWNMSRAGQPNGGWGVLWTGSPSGSFDASRFSRLVVSVKGAKGGERFQVGLADRDGHEEKFESEELVVVSGSGWSRFEVDLDSFASVGRSALANVNLGFNGSHGTGEVCIDEIAFA